MILTFQRSSKTLSSRIFSFFLAFTFIFSSIMPTGAAAQLIPTPAPMPVVGSMVPVSGSYTPAIIRGLEIVPDNPLAFSFMVDLGDSGLTAESPELKNIGQRLINYFMAGLTVPKDEFWVNLSPYEQNRIIPDSLGQTEMGRDMLAQDYLLKQLTASLMYPEDELGSKFWKRVKEKAMALYGTDDIPTNVLNKVWITPESAEIYIHNYQVFLTDSHLKVMLEKDLFAARQEIGADVAHMEAAGELVSSEEVAAVIREVLIPEIEYEINHGKNFATLRQIFNSVILASWYKDNLKESLLGKVYVDQNKLEGINDNDTATNEAIYNQYLEAFKAGVYDYIKEGYDPSAQQMTAKKYFSGGIADLVSLKRKDNGVLGKDLTGSDSATLANQLRIRIANFEVNLLEWVKELTSGIEERAKQKHEAAVRYRDFIDTKERVNIEKGLSNLPEKYERAARALMELPKAYFSQRQIRSLQTRIIKSPRRQLESTSESIAQSLELKLTKSMSANTEYNYNNIIRFVFKDVVSGAKALHIISTDMSGNYHEQPWIRPSKDIKLVVDLFRRFAELQPDPTTFKKADNLLANYFNDGSATAWAAIGLGNTEITDPDFYRELMAGNLRREQIAQKILYFSEIVDEYESVKLDRTTAVTEDKLIGFNGLRPASVLDVLRELVDIEKIIKTSDAASIADIPDDVISPKRKQEHINKLKKAGTLASSVEKQKLRTDTIKAMLQDFYEYTQRILRENDKKRSSNSLTTLGYFMPDIKSMEFQYNQSEYELVEQDNSLVVYSLGDERSILPNQDITSNLLVEISKVLKQRADRMTQKTEEAVKKSSDEEWEEIYNLVGDESDAWLDLDSAEGQMKDEASLDTLLIDYKGHDPELRDVTNVINALPKKYREAIEEADRPSSVADIITKAESEGLVEFAIITKSDQVRPAIRRLFYDEELLPVTSASLAVNYTGKTQITKRVTEVLNAEAKDDSDFDQQLRGGLLKREVIIERVMNSKHAPDDLRAGDRYVLIGAAIDELVERGNMKTSDAAALGQETVDEFDAADLDIEKEDDWDDIIKAVRQLKPGKTEEGLHEAIMAYMKRHQKMFKVDQGAYEMYVLPQMSRIFAEFYEMGGIPLYMLKGLKDHLDEISKAPTRDEQVFFLATVTLNILGLHEYDAKKIFSDSSLPMQDSGISKEDRINTITKNYDALKEKAQFLSVIESRLKAKNNQGDADADKLLLRHRLLTDIIRSSLVRFSVSLDRMISEMRLSLEVDEESVQEVDLHYVDYTLRAIHLTLDFLITDVDKAALEQTDAAILLSPEEEERALLLTAAEDRINTLLDEQYKSGSVTKEIYEKSRKSAFKNFKEWTESEELYRLAPGIRMANLQAVRDGRFNDIVEAYRQEIAFGTAGIRGKAALTLDELFKMKEDGPAAAILKGINTINDVVLLHKTAGVIKYAQETGRTRIVLGYDSRIGGSEFIDMIARLFIKASKPEHEFKLFIFDESAPFPELSFGITTKEVQGHIGIFISASHNPADYNGYKITLETGAQLNQENKNLVLDAVNRTTFADIVLADSLADAKPGQIVWLGGKERLEDKQYYGFDLIDMHTLHVEQVKKLILDKEAITREGRNVNIGFAAFNGAGRKAVPRLLDETDFDNVKVVSKLQELDGLFPAFKYGEQPDPGDPIAGEIAVNEFIKEHGQEAFDELDLLVGTDPDSDRMGAVLKVPESQQAQFGKYRLISANDAWTLLTWYRLMKKKEMGLLENPENHLVVTTHATSDAIAEVAEQEFGVGSYGRMLDMNKKEDRGDYLNGQRTWVGFTYVSEAFEEILKMGKVAEGGYEESNGMSLHGHTNDKDGTLAAILFAEMAAYAKSEGTTLFEMLDEIYLKIGHFGTANKPLPRVGSFEGAAGVSEKINILKKAQEWAAEANSRAGTDNPFMIAGREVIGAVEFKSGRIDHNHYEGVPDEGIRFFFKDENMKEGDHFIKSKNYVMIRPSGTSQTLRFYTQLLKKVDRENIAQQKLENYIATEQLALMTQRQILGDVGLTKYFAMVDAQLAEVSLSNDNAAIEEEKEDAASLAAEVALKQLERAIGDDFSFFMNYTAKLEYQGNVRNIYYNDNRPLELEMLEKVMRHYQKLLIDHGFFDLEVKRLRIQGLPIDNEVLKVTRQSEFEYAINLGDSKPVSMSIDDIRSFIRQARAKLLKNGDIRNGILTQLAKQLSKKGIARLEIQPFLPWTSGWVFESHPEGKFELLRKGKPVEVTEGLLTRIANKAIEELNRKKAEKDFKNKGFKKLLEDAAAFTKEDLASIARISTEIISEEKMKTIIAKLKAIRESSSTPSELKESRESAVQGMLNDFQEYATQVLGEINTLRAKANQDPIEEFIGKYDTFNHDGKDYHITMNESLTIFAQHWNGPFPLERVTGALLRAISVKLTTQKDNLQEDVKALNAEALEAEQSKIDEFLDDAALTVVEATPADAAALNMVEKLAKGLNGQTIGLLTLDYDSDESKRSDTKGLAVFELNMKQATSINAFMELHVGVERIKKAKGEKKDTMRVYVNLSGQIKEQTADGIERFDVLEIIQERGEDRKIVEEFAHQLMDRLPSIVEFGNRVLQIDFEKNIVDTVGETELKEYFAERKAKVKVTQYAGGPVMSVIFGPAALEQEGQDGSNDYLLFSVLANSKVLTKDDKNALNFTYTRVDDYVDSVKRTQDLYWDVVEKIGDRLKEKGILNAEMTSLKMRAPVLGKFRGKTIIFKENPNRFNVNQYTAPSTKYALFRYEGVKEVIMKPDEITESMLRKVIKAANKALEDHAALDPLGGIDLNPDLLDLQIKRDGRGIPLPLDQQPLENMQIDGFLPIIININPVANLPLLLGLLDEDGETNEAEADASQSAQLYGREELSYLREGDSEF